MYMSQSSHIKNSKEPNLGDEDRPALSEQKGTETSSLIRGTVKYKFTIQVFLTDCLQHALHTSLSCPSLSHILSLD